MDKVKDCMKLEDWRHTLKVELTSLANGLDMRSEIQCRIKDDS